MRVGRVWLTLAACAAALTLLADAGRACGVCEQDKVAATYDHAVVLAAAARHHRMLFVSLEGSADADANFAARLGRALRRAPGVDTGTVRVSLAPPAASLAWDPARTSRERLLGALARALAPLHLRPRPIEAVLPSSAIATGRTPPRPALQALTHMP